MVESKAIEEATKKNNNKKKKSGGNSADEAKFRRGLPIATRKVCFKSISF